jgi:hypothetical protein
MHSNLTERCEREFERYVRELHRKKPGEFGMVSADFPWGGACVREDAIPQVWFSKHGPAALQPLPLAKDYGAMMRGSGPRYLLGCYGFSLEFMGYDYLTHPQFFEYARGVMAYPHTPKRVREDPELIEEFPPRPLPGLYRMLWTPEDCTPVERFATVVVQISERHPRS